MTYREAKRYKINDAINMSGRQRPSVLAESNLMITKISNTGKIILFEAYSPLIGTITFNHKKAAAPIMAIASGTKAVQFKIHDVKPSDLVK